MEDNGFVKFHRSLINWEWYQDDHTFRLFFYLIVKANWKDGRFKGHEVPRGSLVTSIAHLAAETYMSVKNVRTALEHLKQTGEISVKTTNKFSLVTITNYGLYQDDNSASANKWQTSGNQVANNRQTSGNQVATIEESKNIRKKEGKNINNTLQISNDGNLQPAAKEQNAEPAEPKTKHFQKPTFEQIAGYVAKANIDLSTRDINEFMDYYTSKGWKVGRESMKDWEAAVRNWARRKSEYSSRMPVTRPTETVTITDRQKINEEFLNGN